MNNEIDILAPIAVFAYNRVDTLERTINALAKNSLAASSDLIVFSDGPKREADVSLVNNVREFLKKIDGFRSVTIVESPNNRGLAESIISGVTSVLEKHKNVIVLEDDVVSSSNFLDFMNAALTKYAAHSEVFSISGFSIPIKSNKDVYFTKRANSSCWATWSNRWSGIDWEVKEYSTFQNSKSERKAFNTMGSDMSSMLDRQMAGQLNSWAIRWCYHQFKHNLYSVYPVVSKSVNIGLEHAEAINTNEKYSRFRTVLDTELKSAFNFPDSPVLEAKELRQFLRPYSLFQRAKYKIINKLFAL